MPEPKGSSRQLLPFDLHNPGRVHKRMPSRCGWVENFVTVDSPSVEALWGDVERRVPAALAAVHAGTPFTDPLHVAALRDLVVLHYIRSLHYRNVHTDSVERAPHAPDRQGDHPVPGAAAPRGTARDGPVSARPGCPGRLRCP